jgi:catechol 2,3-dioxygenase-like lactoylglutathione lyase family enzyme
MDQYIGLISLLVNDYDEAIEYYTRILNFELLEDTELSPAKRWVVVRPRGAGKGCSLLLAKAGTASQATFVGNQTGGRVFLFLTTDNILRDHQTYQQKGVEFVRPIQEESYGKVCVFKDLYGNLWDLIEPASAGSR